jgi:hypothetical protein
MKGGIKEDGLVFNRTRRLKCDRRNFRQPHPEKKKTNMVMSGDQNAGRSYSMRIDRNISDNVEKCYVFVKEFNKSKFY